MTFTNLNKLNMPRILSVLVWINGEVVDTVCSRWFWYAISEEHKIDQAVQNPVGCM